MAEPPFVCDSLESELYAGLKDQQRARCVGDSAVERHLHGGFEWYFAAVNLFGTLRRGGTEGELSRDVQPCRRSDH